MRTQTNKLLKISLLTLVLLTAAVSFHWSEKAVHATSTSAPQPGLTNAPAFPGFTAESNCTDCHATFTLNTVPAGSNATFQILDAPSSYVPGQEYTLRAVLSFTGRSKFGFELTALDPTGKKAGTLANVSNTRTQIASDSSAGTPRDYIYHFPAASGTTTTSTNTAEWSFKWTAPATRVGKITFYASGNAASGTAGSAQDYIYTTSLSITSAPVSVSSGDYNPANPVVSGGNASAFGIELATTTATAGTPIPTTLGGTTVKVKDALSVTRDAQIFFVNPTQVNYLIPDLTANGLAEVTITNSAGVKSVGTVTVASVQPSIFTVTGDGAGLPVAQIQRVNGNTSVFENTFLFNGATWNSVPIEWKNQTERLFLVLYTTGVRKHGGLSSVSGVFGTNLATLPAQYADVSSFLGVDQVNIELDRTLAGKGDVNVVLRAGTPTKSSNTVKLNFK